MSRLAPEPPGTGAGGQATPGAGTPRRKMLLYAPLGIAAAAGVGFWFMLRGLSDGSFNPRGVPSALIGRPPPPFALPPLASSGLPGLASADLVGLPGPVVVNFWASWCVPCIIEHPQLMALSRAAIPVFGINYKDREADAQGFLTRHGNPYARLGVDAPGRASIDWGVYGVPETYVLDRAGVIRWRWAGPIMPETLRDDILPLIRRLAAT
ncbi:MAG: DsbE family thiol:disulfide interchange protein [Rubritepida sp.]|jgi:cytochrome c biogenesis protein CcmG/thiol:disulfide interchange protein DsbE|nr:DsbE family thiol:disulfide interchange protein [Rubritepida sp.]